ncbi:hypothetical protein ACQ4PT_018251 [Festuca glaucescens]
MVRMCKGGHRYEIACFPNKVLSWRTSFKKDLDEVMQSHTFYSYISTGVLVNSKDLSPRPSAPTNSPKYATRCWRKAISKFLARRGSSKLQSGRNTPGGSPEQRRRRRARRESGEARQGGRETRRSPFSIRLSILKQASGANWDPEGCCVTLLLYSNSTTPVYVYQDLISSRLLLVLR